MVCDADISRSVLFVYLALLFLRVKAGVGFPVIPLISFLHSVREFLDLAFDLVGLDWKKHVETDPHYLRPAEVDELCGDASKARRKLGWKPKLSFDELVRTMIEADLELARRENILVENGMKN